jgi:hypothetical protein
MTVRMMLMAMGGGPSVSITNQSATHGVTVPSTATAGYKLLSTGAVQTKGASYADQETWLLAGLNSDCECRATYQSGDALSTGTMDTWEVLSSTRTWTLVATSGLEKNNTTLIEIRRASSGVVLDSCTVTFSAISSP